MSLMLKLFTITLLLSSSIFAATSNKEFVEFLEKKFKSNPNIISLKVIIKDKVAVKELKGWEAYIVSIDAIVKAKPKNREINQKMIWFSDGNIITQDFIDLKTGSSLKDMITPAFKNEYYKKENLIYGNVNAKHKVVIFSDPLCPFCRKFVPKAINEMKKQPNKYAIYYYHFPLPSLHPAAVELTKAAIAAELKGHKDVVLNLYKVNIGANERDVKKILSAFNKTMDTNIKPEDIKSAQVMKHYEYDQKLADTLMVQGTPTMFFDGKMDKSKKKYKEAK